MVEREPWSITLHGSTRAKLGQARVGCCVVSLAGSTYTLFIDNTDVDGWNAISYVDVKRIV
jgi:hypothetical protein